VIRVLVVDDSPTIRAHLRRVIESDPEFVVQAEAADGEAAVVESERLRPDVITMDLLMPAAGVRAIRRIMSADPRPIVIVSSLADEGTDPTLFEGLAAGALTAVRRPPALSDPDFSAGRQELLDTLRSVAGLALIKRQPRRRSGSPTMQSAAVKLELVGVGASTGGPAAVKELLSGLPGDFVPSMLLVQHISPGFAASLADWLSKGSPVPVELARDGMTLPWPGVLVGPDGAHLTIVDGRVRLDPGPARNGHMPSVDCLFESMAAWRPSASAGILLTGMGEDGAAGLGRLRDRGGNTMVQDAESSVVFGMPGSALKLGAASLSLPPHGLAKALVAMVTGGPGDRR